MIQPLSPGPCPRPSFSLHLCACAGRRDRVPGRHGNRLSAVCSSRPSSMCKCVCACGPVLSITRWCVLVCPVYLYAPCSCVYSVSNGPDLNVVKVELLFRVSVQVTVFASVKWTRSQQCAGITHSVSNVHVYLRLCTVRVPVCTLPNPGPGLGSGLGSVPSPGPGCGSMLVLPPRSVWAARAV